MHTKKVCTSRTPSETVWLRLVHVLVVVPPTFRSSHNLSIVTTKRSWRREGALNFKSNSKIPAEATSGVTLWYGSLVYFCRGRYAEVKFPTVNIPPAQPSSPFKQSSLITLRKIICFLNSDLEPRFKGCPPDGAACLSPAPPPGATRLQQNGLLLPQTQTGCAL